MLKKFTNRFMKAMALILAVVIVLGIAPKILMASGITIILPNGHFDDLVFTNDHYVTRVSALDGTYAVRLTNMESAFMADTSSSGGSYQAWQLLPSRELVFGFPPGSSDRRYEIYWTSGNKDFSSAWNVMNGMQGVFMYIMHPEITLPFRYDESLIMLANYQRASSFIRFDDDYTTEIEIAQRIRTLPAVMQTQATPVQDPERVTVGRPADNTFGDFRYSWEIRDWAGRVVASGQRTDYLSGAWTYTVYIESLNLPNGLYTVTSRITERPAVWEGYSFPWHDALVATATGQFRLGSEPEPIDISITKDLCMPAGVATPETTFTFDVELEEIRVRGDVLRPGDTDFTDITITSPYVSFDEGATITTRQVSINFGGVDWPYPGVFVFRVSEQANTNTVAGGTIVYDESEFILYVYVGWECGGIIFQNLTVVGFDTRHAVPCSRNTACTAYVTCEDDDECCGNCEVKPPLVFENQFYPHSSLEVHKLVTGMGDVNAPFDFTMELNLPAGHRPATLTATLTRLARNNYNQFTGGTPETTTLIFDVGADGVATPRGQLQFKHGDIIIFNNLPVNTTYTLTEPAVANYEQSAVVISGGASGGTFNQNETPPYALVVNGTIRFGTNSVVVTNYLREAEPMGVLFGNAPFGLMVAIGAGALMATGAVAVLHGKKKMRR